MLLVVAALFFSLPFWPAFFSKTDQYGLASNRPAPNFSLHDKTERLVSLANYKGKFIFLMFGYLNCDDVCHTEALMFQEINHIADMQDKLHFVYVGMDPGRDSSEDLAAYFDVRGENFTSLKGRKTSDIQALASKYSAYFSRSIGDSSEDYEIRHKGRFFLIGPDGFIRRTYSALQKNAHLVARDLAQLRQEYQI